MNEMNEVNSIRARLRRATTVTQVLLLNDEFRDYKLASRNTRTKFEREVAARIAKLQGGTK